MFCFRITAKESPSISTLGKPNYKPILPPRHTPSLPLQKEKLPVNKRNLTGKLLRVTEQPTFHPKLKPPLEPTAPTSTPQK
ncbi:uncharacterized protein LOC128035915 isoform X4 [Gossypium raimondii]|uniref:uncharacterized protein LOC128035915 isoform X4 n=1 Tax=Gossypium raimondii TaxID=29730 RepID=UPI00227C5281|nr:uncharacterized protein LOC128035915 isoform X4 [Gossypium raimondii]